MSFRLTAKHPAQGSAKVRRWLRRLEKKLMAKLDSDGVRKILNQAYFEMALTGESRIYTEDLK